jgi:hypothetical protein
MVGTRRLELLTSTVSIYLRAMESWSYWDSKGVEKHVRSMAFELIVPMLCPRKSPTLRGWSAMGLGFNVTFHCTRNGLAPKTERTNAHQNAALEESSLVTYAFVHERLHRESGH